MKVIVFSEWERMLELVRDLCRRLRFAHAWHTGSVPQQRRRGEINRFKSDPDCRVFLSTDSGGVGLNLQIASVVVNCDLPWNPARLEQRIARAWRKQQTRAVTVYNLVSEKTIEHGMLATLADKRSLADGVLDRVGDLKEIKLRSGRQAQLARLEQVMLAGVSATPSKPAPPADPAAAFVRAAAAAAGSRLVACEERYPAALDGAPVLVAVVERESELWRPQFEAAHAEAWKQTPAVAPRLLVLDRATQAALEALAASGLVAVTTAATRRLHPAPEAAAALSPEDQQRAAAHRARAARRLKAAQALLAADLREEAVPHARDALQALACALALECRLPAPPDADACARPPWSGLFPRAVPLLTPDAGGDGGADPASLVTLLAETLGDGKSTGWFQTGWMAPEMRCVIP